MNPRRSDTTNRPDHSEPIILPPIAWAMAAIAGEALDFLSPAPLMSFGTFMPWIGGTVFAAGFALAIWSRAALRKIGTPMVPGKPTSAIATDGAYGFSRNPIYVAMLLGQIGLAIGLNNAWLLAATAPLYLVLRYGIVAREETYLERKFGSHYIAYKARVPRWF